MTKSAEVIAEQTLRQRGWKRKDARFLMSGTKAGLLLRALERGEKISSKRAASWFVETALEAAWLGFCEGHDLGYQLGVEIMQQDKTPAAHPDPLEGLTWEDLSEIWDEM